MASSRKTPKASDEHIVSKLVLRRVTKENTTEVSSDIYESELRNSVLTSHPLDLRTAPIFSYDENSQMTTIENSSVQRRSVSDEYVVSKIIFHRVRKENATEVSSGSNESTLSSPVSSGEEFSCVTATDKSSSSGSARTSAAVSSSRQPKKVQYKPPSRTSFINSYGTRHLCRICGKSFVRIEFLKRHVKVHPKIPPYKCSLCDKAFYLPTQREVHERVHTGEKPFECKICMKSFSTSSYLSVHNKTHSGVKPHKCNVCRKSFITSSKLTRHKKIHRS